MSTWGIDIKTKRLRNPCPEDPEKLGGIGMYHCPNCGEMQVGAVPHLLPERDYEVVYGMDWPLGYVENPATEEIKQALSAYEHFYDGVPVEHQPVPWLHTPESTS
jgi:hypothetical protein